MNETGRVPEFNAPRATNGEHDLDAFEYLDWKSSVSPTERQSRLSSGLMRHTLGRSKVSGKIPVYHTMMSID